MAQETKELVLQDICSRLLYGLRVRIYNHWTDSFEDEILSIDNIGEILHNFPIEDIKPYLRPMSSMTEEEKKEFTEFASISQHRFFIGDSYFWYNTYEEEDWLNEHHFDYRGLIEKGLVLEAPKDMYKF